MRLQHRDGIPVHRELVLLPNVVCTKGSFDITILYQALGAPESDTERCVCGLVASANRAQARARTHGPHLIRQMPILSVSDTI